MPSTGSLSLRLASKVCAHRSNQTFLKGLITHFKTHAFASRMPLFVSHCACTTAPNGYDGYFVRRNVNVGRRPNGGYECELDVVAFHPGCKHLVHIEPSMDANPWSVREERYRKKFEAGRKFIPELFKGIEIPDHIDQIALFGLGSRTNWPTLSGGKVMLISDLLIEITRKLRPLRVERAAVSEQFPLLRTIQFMCQHEKLLSAGNA